ncbi:MAG: glycosyltransferase family 1 protein [bacterium]
MTKAPGTKVKIAVNTRLLLKNRLEGIGWFTFETLSRIVRSHPEHEFLFLFDRKYDNRFIFADNISPVVVAPQARHPLLFYWWFEISIPQVLKKYKADIFVSTDAFLSLRANCKTLLVIHDLNFEHYPQHLPWLVRRYYRHFTPKFVRKATRIATVSEYSRKDIMAQYGVVREKIDVVHNGANPIFRPVEEKVQEKIRSKYTQNCSFFVFISAISPRKNLTNLLKAFDLFRKNETKPVKLLVVGEKMWWTDSLKQTYEAMQFKEEVIFAGRLSQDELAKVVASALALTYVSFFEGFGIPIIEAFSSGTPVITSNVTSMPEVAGDAAITVDPGKVEEIAGAMQTIANDPAKRKELIEKGKIRSNMFSWDITADKLWQSVEKAFNS